MTEPLSGITPSRDKASNFLIIDLGVISTISELVSLLLLVIPDSNLALIFLTTELELCSVVDLRLFGLGLLMLLLTLKQIACWFSLFILTIIILLLLQLLLLLLFLNGELFGLRIVSELLFTDGDLFTLVRG